MPEPLLSCGWRHCTAAESTGLQADSGGAEELVKNTQGWSTEELQRLLAEQQRTAAEELSEEERECQQSVQLSSFDIKEILEK